MSSKLNVFDIQRTSFVDGPGIRTTVFLKGCSLRCKWCHNPESWMSVPQLMYYEKKCTHCGVCDRICPNNAAFSPDKCLKCGKCVSICPNSARELCGEECTTKEIFEEIIKDKAFFDRSHGGVTFSGGECLLQSEALAEVMMLCKSAGIHTAIDTAGNVPYLDFKNVLPYTDLFLYDIKTMDSEKHRKYTGSGNEQILANLLCLAKEDVSIWIRIPLIAGVNDSIEEAVKIRDFLKNIEPERVELLPYHKMGISKYRAVFHEEAMGFVAPSKDKVEELHRIITAGL